MWNRELTMNTSIPTGKPKKKLMEQMGRSKFICSTQRLTLVSEYKPLYERWNGAVNKVKGIFFIFLFFYFWRKKKPCVMWCVFFCQMSRDLRAKFNTHIIASRIYQQIKRFAEKSPGTIFICHCDVSFLSDCRSSVFHLADNACHLRHQFIQFSFYRCPTRNRGL